MRQWRYTARGQFTSYIIRIVSISGAKQDKAWGLFEIDDKDKDFVYRQHNFYVANGLLGEQCYCSGMTTEQNSKIRMHSSRMRTTRSLLYKGGSMSRGVSVRGGSLSRETPPPMNRMTDRCKNVTLAQTSFAGGNHTINI